MHPRDVLVRSLETLIAPLVGTPTPLVSCAAARYRIGPVPKAYSVLVPELVGRGGRLSTLMVTDERARGGGGGFLLRALIFFDHEGLTVEVQEMLAADQPVLPSITASVPAAHWQEREAAEMFGLVLENHPEPGRHILHHHVPVDLFPLRKDVSPELSVPFAQGVPLPFRPVHGEGIHEIAVGPIHAGIIEPGHFRFSALGERIVHLQIRLGWQHKGTERLFEGQPVSTGVHLAERISGDTSLGHAMAYCQAIEDLSGTVVPVRGLYLRALALELERLANHVGDLGGLAGDIGHAFGAAHFGRLRGEFLNKAELLTGSRFLRGFCCPGGVRDGLDEATSTAIRTWIPRVGIDFTQTAEKMLNADTVVARMEGVGLLAASAVKDLGIVGPAARASGVSIDVRRDFAAVPYATLGLGPIVEPGGDVMARARVRYREVLQSLELVRRLLETAPGGEIRAPVGSLAPYTLGLGHVEGWRGEIVTGVIVDEAGLLWRVRVRDPSVQNWIGLAQAAELNLVTDFPLCNKSFNLSYSGHDL